MGLYGPLRPHLNYFIRDIGHTGTFLCVNRTNPGFSRIREYLDYAGEMGRQLAVVTNSETLELPASAIRIPAPDAEYPMTMPATLFVPFSAFAGILSGMIGEKYGRGSEGPWAGSAGGRGVNQSRIEIIEKPDQAVRI